MSLFDKAKKTVSEDRQDDYGSATQNLADIAKMWTVYLEQAGNIASGTTISAKDVCQMMILLKVVRESKKHKHDNLVDICGYTAIMEQIEDEQNRVQSGCRKICKRTCCQ